MNHFHDTDVGDLLESLIRYANTPHRRARRTRPDEPYGHLVLTDALGGELVELPLTGHDVAELDTAVLSCLGMARCACGALSDPGKPVPAAHRNGYRCGACARGAGL